MAQEKRDKKRDILEAIGAVIGWGLWIVIGISLVCCLVYEARKPHSAGGWFAGIAIAAIIVFCVVVAIHYIRGRRPAEKE